MKTGNTQTSKIRDIAWARIQATDILAYYSSYVTFISMAPSNRSVSPISVVQLVAGMALFGTTTPLSKIIGQHFSVFTASFLRMVIATLVLAPFVWVLTNKFAKAERSDFLVIGAIAAFGMIGFTVTMLLGMRMTTGVIGSTIMSATPAVTAFAAVIFMGASFTKRNLGALALAIAGITAINLFSGTNAGRGDAVVFGAALVVLAICFEAAYTLLSRKLSTGITSIEATFAASLFAAPAFIVLAFIFEPQPFSFPDGHREAWTALLFWGAMTGGLAPVLWYNGVRSAPAQLSAGAMSVMPVTALISSYWLLSEQFRWPHLIGFGLVFIGLVLMLFEHAEGKE